MRKNGLTLLVALLLAVGPMSAGESEICFFAAGAGDDPFSRWLTSQSVTCVASDAAIPPGKWNVFARTETSISTEPHLVESDVQSSTPLHLALTPATTIGLELPEGHTAVAWATRSATAFPVEDGSLVPAGEPLLLIVLRDRTAVGSLFVPSVDAGRQRTIDLRDGGRPTLLAWTVVPAEHLAALRTTSGAISPRIELVHDGGTHPITGLPHLELLHDAIVFAQDVPPGRGEIEIGGRGWLPAKVPVTFGSDRVTLVREPLPLRASATLTIEWHAVHDLQKLDARIGSCEPVPAEFALAIARCAEPRGEEAIDADSCSVVHAEALPVEAKLGSTTLEEMEPGAYRIALTFGKLPPTVEYVRLAPLASRPVSVQAIYSIAYGTLTRGGEPLDDDAKIRFPHGGIGFSVGGEGEYEAALIHPFGVDARIEIETCHGERMLSLSDTAMRVGGRFNIDVPDNALTIRVTDTFTRELLRQASIDYQIMSLSIPRRPVLEGKLERREDGTFAMRSVPERELRLQVRHPGYQKHNVAPFSLTGSETKDLEVQLVPLRGRQGKITSAHPFADATIHWYSSRGRIERVDVEPDGTFFHEADHSADETMAVVSSSHPLWVTRSPAVERHRQLQIRYPDAASVTALELPEGRGLPLLTIGGLAVPPGVLRSHLTLRDIHRRPPAIPAIVQSGRIEATEP